MPPHDALLEGIQFFGGFALFDHLGWPGRVLINHEQKNRNALFHRPIIFHFGDALATARLPTVAVGIQAQERLGLVHLLLADIDRTARVGAEIFHANRVDAETFAYMNHNFTVLWQINRRAADKEIDSNIFAPLLAAAQHGFTVPRVALLRRVKKPLSPASVACDLLAEKVNMYTVESLLNQIDDLRRDCESTMRDQMGGGTLCQVHKDGRVTGGLKYQEGRLGGLGNVRRAIRRLPADADLMAALADFLTTETADWSSQLQRYQAAERPAITWVAYYQGGVDTLHELARDLLGQHPV